MFAEIVVSHPVAVGLVPWPYPRTTIVVKATLEPGARGELAPVTAPDAVDPLHLDVADASGRLVAATDFAPYKPACDVLVAVLEEREHVSPGRLVVGPLDLPVAPFQRLGPLPSALPGGDPGRDPASWSGADVTYERFQSAPPERRIPWPAGDLVVDYRRGPWPLHARYPGLLPRVTLVFPDGERVAVPMALDTIEIVATRRRVVVSFRGIAAHARDPSAARLEIELVDRLGFPLVGGRWQPAAAETAAGRRPPVGAAHESFADDPEVTAPAMRSPAATLPFAGAHSTEALPFTADAPGHAPSVGLDSGAFAALRRVQPAPATELIDDPGTIDETGTGTVSVATSSAYHPAPVFRAVDEAPPPPAAAPAAPADPPLDGGSPGGVQELDRWMRECAAIRVALWSGLALGDVLRERGLDEASYRATEARLKAVLDRELEQGRLDSSERFLHLLDEARASAPDDAEVA